MPKLQPPKPRAKTVSKPKLGPPLKTPRVVWQGTINGSTYRVVTTGLHVGRLVEVERENEDSLGGVRWDEVADTYTIQCVAGRMCEQMPEWKGGA